MRMNLLFNILMMIVCTTSGCVSENEPDGPSLGAGQVLPQFEVAMNNGETVSTSTLKDKVAVIVFFNTDCGDCRQELPVIQQLWERYEETPDVEVVAISREESETDISTYWEENGLTMPFSPQETREVYSLFASNVIPRIYIANREGIIIATYDDSNMPTLQDLTDIIENAL